MSEPTDFSTGSLLQWVTALLTGILGFLGMRLYTHVDRLNKETVTRAELEKIQVENRADRVALHGENQTRLERIESKIDVQVAIVQRLNYVETELERLRSWKHDTIDPYIPGEFNAIKLQLNRIEERMSSHDHRRSTDR